MITKEELNKFELSCPQTKKECCGKMNGLYLSHQEANAEVEECQRKVNDISIELMLALDERNKLKAEVERLGKELFEVNNLIWKQQTNCYKGIKLADGKKEE